MGRAYVRGIAVVAAYRPRGLVEHLAGRATLTTGVPPEANPAAEEESDEFQEQSECPFDPFHGDSFQGVW